MVNGEIQANGTHETNRKADEGTSNGPFDNNNASGKHFDYYLQRINNEFNDCTENYQ